MTIMTASPIISCVFIVIFVILPPPNFLHFIIVRLALIYSPIVLAFNHHRKIILRSCFTS